MWVVTRYEPSRRIEFVRMNAIRVSCLSYTLIDDNDGTTRALIDLLLVGLTEQGNRSIDGIAENLSFEFGMGEAMLNHYLTTGKMLPLQETVAIVSKIK